MNREPDRPPEPPSEPDPAECCGSGCIRCIWDLYAEARERYQAELVAWRLRHSK